MVLMQRTFRGEAVANTKDAISGTDVRCPPIPEVMGKYLAYLVLPEAGQLLVRFCLFSSGAFLDQGKCPPSGGI